MTERPDLSPITSPRSERVRRIAALSGRSARRKQGRFRVEGPQSVRSLLRERPDLVRELHLTERARRDHPELADLAAAAGITARETEEQIIRAMVRDTGGAEDGPHRAGEVSHRAGEGPHRAGGAPDADGAAVDGAGGAVNPQGVIAVAQLPSPDPQALADALAALPAEGPVTVTVLHEVRDPGNVGTLIRTADAAGADLVVLTRTCADPYAPKAVRASVGSIFHLPVMTGTEAPHLLDVLSEQAIVTAATSGHAQLDLYDAELPGRIAWWFGNEARGLDDATLAAAPLSVRIPLAGRAESLNVHTAATVCLFESLRRRMRS